MISPSKTSKRLGIVGAAAVVGLVPISVLAAPAFAASGATLALASNAAGVSTTATNIFTTTQAGTNQITIANELVSPAAGGTGETLPACISNGAATPTCTNYTVTYTAPGGTATADPVLVAGTAPAAPNPPVAPGAPGTGTLALANPIATAGSSVTVTITGVVNGSASAVVEFADTDTNTTAGLSGAQAQTNTVTIASAPPVAAASVTGVNPTAFNTAPAVNEPFTITGTGFAPGTAGGGIAGNPPVVCFVPTGTTVPTPTGTGTAGTATTNCPAADVALLTSVVAGQIQGTAPNPLAKGNYNVVVYNWNPAANSNAGGYTLASATSSQTLVAAVVNLNFVPESGVRIVDSRSGLSLPKGTLATGSPVAISLSNFAQSPTMPTNLPAGYTGLDVNVTAVAPASGGNIQMWTQAGAACPNGINPATKAATEPATVNFQPPQDTNNSQVIPVAAGANTLCVQDNGAAVNLVVDLDGYTTADGGGTYTAPAGAARLLDTRTGTGSGATTLLGPLQSGTVYRFNTGLGAGAEVALNVAAVAPTSQGYVTVFPEPATGAPTSASGVPNTAVANFIPGTDSSAMLVTTTTPAAPAASAGYLDIYSGGTGTYNLVIDELGTFGASSLKTLAQPIRVYDSRPGPIGSGATVTTTGSPSGSGSNFVPSGAVGLVGNLSDINPAGQGYLATFPAGGVLPGTASIANFPLQTRNTNNVVALNPSNGSFSIYAGGAATNTTYDASGYIN